MVATRTYIGPYGKNVSSETTWTEDDHMEGNPRWPPPQYINAFKKLHLMFIGWSSTILSSDMKFKMAAIV